MCMLVPVQTLVLNAFRYSRDENEEQKVSITYRELVQYKNRIAALLSEKNPDMSVKIELTPKEIDRFCRESSKECLYFNDQIFLLEDLDDVSVNLVSNGYDSSVIDIFKKAASVKS